MEIARIETNQNDFRIDEDIENPEFVSCFDDFFNTHINNIIASPDIFFEMFPFFSKRNIKESIGIYLFCMEFKKHYSDGLFHSHPKMKEKFEVLQMIAI